MADLPERFVWVDRGPTASDLHDVHERSSRPKPLAEIRYRTFVGGSSLWTVCLNWRGSTVPMPTDFATLDQAKDYVMASAVESMLAR